MTVLALRTGEFPLTRRLAYQEQDSPLTLAQGLGEYYRANGGRVLPPASLPPESAALFKSHDICHVIFGLDTSLYDEAMADTRTLLSCDVGFARYTGYLVTNKETQAIFKEIGFGAALWGTLKTLPRMARALRENFRMAKKWPWVPPEEYMERSLGDLRREYGIRVI
ncbi:MAG: hypothetical protein ACTHLR_12105 [Rhizomicrobium sp.]